MGWYYFTDEDDIRAQIRMSEDQAHIDRKKKQARHKLSGIEKISHHNCEKLWCSLHRLFEKINHQPGTLSVMGIVLGYILGFIYAGLIGGIFK